MLIENFDLSKNVLIIAEIGNNHEGIYTLAEELIGLAVESGVDAVKFQLLTAEGLYVKDAGKFKTDWGDEVDIYDVWKKTEMEDYF